MNRPSKITAAYPLGGTAPASPSPVGVGALSLDIILRDARLFEREHTQEGELEALKAMAENLLRVPCGSYAEECLRDFKSSLECALENEAEDRRWNNANRIEL